MSSHRRKPRKDRPLPPLRAYLRAKLVHTRDQILERDGVEGIELFDRAFDFGRVEQLDAGEPVGVYLWEVSDLVPADQRAGIYEGTRMILLPDGRLR